MSSFKNRVGQAIPDALKRFAQHREIDLGFVRSREVDRDYELPMVEKTSGRAVRLRQTRNLERIGTPEGVRRERSSQTATSTKAPRVRLTKVFVDTRARYEAATDDSYKPIVLAIAEESYKRIVSTISDAGVGVTVVDRQEDAEIVLAFSTSGWIRPSCSSDPGYGPDVGVGEVYVVHANSLRVVMLFDEECRVWRRWLATTFAEAFVRAYRAANSERARSG